MADNTIDTGKPLTGRKVFFIFFTAFAVIFGVNIFMAYSAVGTFPGVEVANSYIASQSFDADRKAQEALGWAVNAEVDGTSLKLDIVGRDGAPARLSALEGMIGRTTERQHDQALVFGENSLGSHVAEVGALAPGKWEFRLLATAEDGTRFKQRLQIVIPES